MEIGTEMLTPVARIVPSRLPPHSARPLEHSAIPTVNDRILSTDHKVESQLPGTKRFTIEMNDTNFMVYQRGRDFTTGAEGEVELPKAIQDAMLFFSKLNLQQRNGQCISVSADLISERIAKDYVIIQPARSDDNIRGMQTAHYVAGVQLADGRYVYMDGTWPFV